MNKNFKYIIYFSIVIFGIGILPNLILRSIWSYQIATLNMVLNSLIIPISLLFARNRINQKFKKDWWLFNYVLIVGTVCLSIYLGFLNWAYKADKTPGGWGSDNVDKGTYMILNLELIMGLGIIGFALAIKIIKAIINRKKEFHNNIST